MEAFTPSRTLLNPKFEGYKLDPIHHEDSVVRFPLQYRPSQAAMSGRSSFSYQEVESRIRHNHLAVCPQSRRAAYVDASLRVVLIDVDRETAQPSIFVLLQLPAPVYASHGSQRNREYPSATFLTPTILVVSDGYGLMFTIQIQGNGLSEVLGIFALSNIASNTPFRIHRAYRMSPLSAVVLLSYRHYPEEDEIRSSSSRTPSSIEYNVSAVKIELTSLRPSGDIHPLDVLWSRRGTDPPIYTAYQEEIQSFLLVGGSTYSQIGQPSPPYYYPSPEDIAPIPRVGENLDAAIVEPLKPPPYSWTQSSDSVTVAIPLPSNTPKHTIQVLFSPRTLTVHVDNDILTTLPIPRYSAKPLWDGISSSTSYWTWDREAEHTFGLLTLYLDKQHEGTRWSQVFASSGTSIASESSTEDIEVPETLDPSELWYIRETLEKYTAALREGDDASGLGLGKGMPSLAEGEMDMEVDESVGKSAYATWVGEGGTAPQWQKESVPFQLLSVPLPGRDPTDLSLIIKNNVDGTVFSLRLEKEGEQVIPAWIHTSTFSALAFVLASKRDTRFTYHASESVFAFEGGLQDRGGNVYIYRAALKKEKWAKQGILKIGGPLLGVGIVDPDQKPSLICLTETELVLVKQFE